MSAFCKRLLVKFLFWLEIVLGVEREIMLLAADRREEFVIPRHWSFFDPATAATLNPTQAAIFHKVKAWVDTNTRAGRNRHGDKCWTFNSYRQWADTEFLWLHKNTVGKALKALVNEGWLVSETQKADGTLRYTTGSKAVSPLQQIVVPPTPKRGHNNKSQQKSLPKTPTKKPAATKVPSKVTSIPPAPVVAAAFNPPDSGKFFSGTIPENQPVDTRTNNAGSSASQESPCNTPGKTTYPPHSAPPPLPSEKREFPALGAWQDWQKRDVRLFFKTSSLMQLEKMFVTYAPDAVLDWIDATREMSNLNNPQGFVIARLRSGDKTGRKEYTRAVEERYNREWHDQPAPANPYISGQYADFIEH
ncbi:MAG: hypothetical protein H6672_22510 [Anaerolineaceae bacterium]|nr:hypothetical protein [Anaerolineaceae bacterium]